MAMDSELRLLVHAAAIETHMAMNFHVQRSIEATGDGVLAHRVFDRPIAFIGVLGRCKARLTHVTPSF
jgi:hypothetical protein